MVEDNWSYLIKEGEAPQWAIDDAGLTIYSDYCTAIGGVQMAALIERTSTITALSFKIERIGILIEAAKMVSEQNLIQALAEEGYTLQAARMESASEDEAYQNAVNSIASQLKAENTRLKAMIADRQKMEGKQHKTTDEDFMESIIAIETVLKSPPIDEDSMKLEKYCAYVRKLHRHIEYLNRQAKKRAA